MEVATGTTHITTPEPETENPIRIQPGKALSFTNGVLKRHHHPPPPVTYKECLKNHAASMGGHAVDGCGEFMPSPAPLKCAAPDAAPLKCAAPDPGSLKCAACGCHRNFHRREPDEPPPAVVQHVIEYQPHHRHHPPPPPPPHSSSSPDSLSPPPISSSYYPSAPHMLLALSAGVSTPPADPNPSIPAGAGITSPTIGNPNGRKRFRTKFTQNQKEKMQEFAERIKWKIQRSDEVLITEFCSEIGVDRGVLKVWMHNNKGNLGKKDANNNGPEIDHINLIQNLHNTTNGSCSSS